MLISEQVKELRKAAKLLNESKLDYFGEISNEAAETIESLSAKLQALRWIYCEDGKNLPEKEGWYITSYKLANGKEVSHELYFDGEDWIDEDEGKEFYVKPTIVAWQNMPEPYKESEK